MYIKTIVTKGLSAKFAHLKTGASTSHQILTSFILNDVMKVFEF